MRIAWGLLVAAAACARPGYDVGVNSVFSWTRGDLVQAPETLKPAAWRVGQTALYARRDGRQRMFDQYTVVARDACGFWIERITQTTEHRWRWMFCFEYQPQRRDMARTVRRVIEEIDADPPVVRRMSSDELSDLVSVFVPPTWLDDWRGSREDIAVRAGQYVGTVRARAPWPGHAPKQLTVWAHPSVPFGAVVKIESDDGTYEQELVDTRQMARESIVNELVRRTVAAEAPARGAFIALGIGATRVTGNASEDHVETGGLAGTLGVDATPDVAAILAAWSTSAASYTRDPAATLATSGALLGLRWSFRHYRQRWLGSDDALYVQAGLGFSELDRFASDTAVSSANGFAAGVSVGYKAGWRGYASIIEISDAVGVYEKSEGVRQNLSITIGLQLYIPGLRF